MSESPSADRPEYPGRPQYPGGQQPYPGQPQYPGGQQPNPGQQGYPAGQQPYPGQQGYPGQPQYPTYTGGNAALPPTPKAPGSVNGAFLIFVLTAALLVVGVVLAVNSSIWDEAIRDAQTQSTVTLNVSTLKTVVVAVGVIFAALYLFFAFMMRAGRNWSRIVLTVVAALSLASSFNARSTVNVNGRVYTSSSSQLTGWIGVALSVLAIVLMFLPASNQYFSASKAARQARR